MIANLLLVIFALLLVLIPLLFYKNDKPSCVILWKRLALDRNARMMAVNILALLVIFFHLVYYAASPSEIGVLFSTPVIFFLLLTKRTVKMLLAIRERRWLQVMLSILCIALPLLPHMLPCAITIAFVLLFAFFFPSKQAADFYKTHYNDKDVDGKFVEAYFK